MKYLFLENKNGKVIRTFLCDQVSFFAVKRIETGRLELWTTDALKTNKHIPVQVLSFIPESIPVEGLFIPSIGTFKQGRYPRQLQYDIKADLQYSSQHSRSYICVLFFIFFVCCLTGFILKSPVNIQKIKEEFQVDFAQPRIEAQIKTLIVERFHNNFGEKIINVNKKKISSNNMSNELLAIRNNTQKLKINLGSVFSLEDKSFVTSEKSKDAIRQNIYDKSIFSASNTSDKLESTDGYVKIEKKNGYGKIALINEVSFSKNKKGRGGKGGLTIEQQRALNDFMSKEEGVLRFCYERGLQVFPEFTGDIYLSWRVDNKGKAQSIRILRLGMNKSLNVDLNEFKKCITDHVGAWFFPLILKGKPIHYTFQFHPFT